MRAVIGVLSLRVETRMTTHALAIHDKTFHRKWYNTLRNGRDYHLCVTAQLSFLSVKYHDSLLSLICCLPDVADEYPPLGIHKAPTRLWTSLLSTIIHYFPQKTIAQILDQKCTRCLNNYKIRLVSRKHVWGIFRLHSSFPIAVHHSVDMKNCPNFCYNACCLYGTNCIWIDVVFISAKALLC